MNMQSCEFLAEKYDLQYKNQCVWGFMEKYPVWVAQVKDKVLLNVGITFKTEVGRRGMEELLSERDFLDPYGVSYARLTDQMIQADFPESENRMAKMECLLLWIVTNIPKFTGVPFECFPLMASRLPLLPEEQQTYKPKKGEVLCSDLVKKQGEMDEEQYVKYMQNTLREQSKAIDRYEGSYVRGAVGALLGAIVGAIPWALVGCFGWIASWLGYLIALAAIKGYDLMNGKWGKARLGIIIGASVVGSLAGTLGAEVLHVGRLILSGTLKGTLADIPSYLYYTFQRNGDYRISLLVSLLVGLLFILLGSRSVIKEIRDERQ